ncbi:hypothetical protein NDU88_006928 [Pleurodeles waltl]|uniref:Uncharacterized protein n=1 Tax=Pleurodeles waltl TaxID=8319 RepID=A0AAV7LQK3_PLEWA|nr:hypothetical protein NDU88_006928 [Pleurodeles waltl]
MDIHTLKEQFWQIKRQILDFYDEYVVTYTRNRARGLFSSMHISLLAEPDILFICKVEEVTEQLMETTARQFENLKKENDHQLSLKEQYATSCASPKTAIKQIFPAMNECQETAPVINISASSSDSLSACSFPENIPVQLTESLTSLRDLTPLDSKDRSESSEGSVSAPLSEQIKPKEEESSDADSNSCTLRNQDMTLLEINGKLCNSVEESESSDDSGSCLAVNKPADSAVQMAHTPEFSDCGNTPALSNNIIEFSDNKETPVLFQFKEQPFSVNRAEDQLPVVETPCKETISDTTNTPQSTCNEEISVLSEDHPKELVCGTSTFSDVNPVSKDLKTLVDPVIDTPKSSKTKENSEYFMFTLRTPVTHVSQVSMLCKPQTTINANTAAETDISCSSEGVTDLTNTPIMSSKEDSTEQETKVLKNTAHDAIPDLLAPESTSPETNSMHSSCITRTIKRKDIGAHMGINTCFAHWMIHLWQDCKLINQGIATVFRAGPTRACPVYGIVDSKEGPYFMLTDVIVVDDNDDNVIMCKGSTVNVAIAMVAVGLKPIIDVLVEETEMFVDGGIGLDGFLIFMVVAAGVEGSE